MSKLLVVLVCLVALLGAGQGQEPECTGKDQSMEPTSQGKIDKIIQRWQGKPITDRARKLIRLAIKSKRGIFRKLLGSFAADPKDPAADFSALPSGNINVGTTNFLAKYLGPARTVVGYLMTYGYFAKVLNQSKKESDNYIGVIPPCGMTNAVREFQRFNQITPADGILTPETITLMAEDRCGNPDVKCETTECKKKDRYDKGTGKSLRKKRYAVRRKKWKISRNGKYYVGYYFENYYDTEGEGKELHDKGMTPEVVRREVEKGLQEWTKYAGVNFVEVDNADDAHVTIRFGTLEHGEKNAKQYFDGAYGVLAHMYYPRNGRMHFDGAENFTASNRGPGINLHFVVAHEMGHGLGIEHSGVRRALMAPYYSGYKEQMLDDDDIKAVRNLYGKGTGELHALNYVEREDQDGGSDTGGGGDGGGGDGGGGDGDNVEIEENGSDNGTDEPGVPNGDKEDGGDGDKTIDRLGCIEHFRAGFSDPNEDYIYLFYNENNYLRLEPKAPGHGAFPKVEGETGTKYADMLISDKFPGLMGPYDAAVTDDKHQVTYLFANGEVTTWDWSSNQIGSLNGEPIENTVFASLPIFDITAVARYNDLFLFFTDGRYYVYSTEDGVLDPQGHPAPEDGEMVASAFHSFFNGYIYTTKGDQKENNVYDLMKAKRVTTGVDSVDEFENAILSGYGDIDIDDDTMFGWPDHLEFCQPALWP